MALEVIGAGLGRTGTLSLKFALEHLGFGPCCHMTEVFADGRRLIPLWLDAARGAPDWPAVFAGFRSTCDYPSASYWRELAAFYPRAKLVLTVVDPDRWFDSVSQTIFSTWMQQAHAGTPEHELMQRAMFDHINGDVTDHAFLTEWFARRNDAVRECLPADRLLVFDPSEGWDPLCRFLSVAVPEVPFPAINQRAQLGGLEAGSGSVSGSAKARERFTRQYIETMRARAFGSPG